MLRPNMTVAQFDAGYFYAAELKSFAKKIGIHVGNFRKIELEELIREYLRKGVIPKRRPVLPRETGKERDPLAADNPVQQYVGDRKTKDFLLELVHRKSPGLKDKSGQWYWLNDWRRQMQERHAVFSYRDLADHLRKLMSAEGRLPQIPSARMNNFITDFRADPANRNVTRQEILTAWNALKQMQGPKTYAAYRKEKRPGRGS